MNGKQFNVLQKTALQDQNGHIFSFTHFLIIHFHQRYDNGEPAIYFGVLVKKAGSFGLRKKCMVSTSSSGGQPNPS